MSENRILQGAREALAHAKGETPAPFFHDRGGRYAFNRRAIEDETGGIEMAQLADDELLVYPGWVYKREDTP